MIWVPFSKTVVVSDRDEIDWPARGLDFTPPTFPAVADLDHDDLAWSMARNLAKSTLRPSVLNARARICWKLLDALIDRSARNLTARSARHVARGVARVQRAMPILETGCNIPTW